VTALDRKLLRDLWRMRGQVLAIALVIGAAMATFVMALGVHRSLIDTRTAYYDRSGFADVFASMTRAPRNILDRVAKIEGVSKVEGRIQQYATLELPGRVEPVRAIINSVGDEGRSSLNRIVLRKGRGPGLNSADEVVVDEAFATANGFDLGDEMDAIIYGNRTRLRIVGIGLAPDYIYSIAPGEFVPDESRFGIFWMGAKALEGATNLTGAINSLGLTLQHGASEAEVIRQLDALVAPYGGTGAYGREDHLSHAFLDNELTQLEAMTAVIPPIFLIVSTFLVFIVLGRMIRTERAEIGLLKAFGYTNAAIGGHYLKFALATALLGIAIGCALGYWLGFEIVGLYGDYYRLPFLFFSISPDIFLLGALLSVGSAALGAIGGVRAATALTAAEAMSPPPPPVYQAGVVERLGVKAGFSAVGHMIVRHVARWPGRSAVTVFGVSLSLGLLFATLQFIDSSTAMVEDFFFRAQRQDLTVSFIEPRNEDVVRALRNVPGVLAVEPVNSVPVRISSRNHTERTAIESAGLGARLTARIDAAGKEVSLPAAGLMLSEPLARQLDVRPGEVVHVETLIGRRLRSDLPVTRTLDELVGTRAYAETAVINRLLRDSAPIGAALVKIDPAARDDILLRLREMPVVLGVTERAATLQLFEEVVEDNILTMVVIYIGFAGAIAVGVIYNSARILFSERARELATLRVLGYHRREVGIVLLGELALLVVVAVPVGCFLGYWMAQLMVAMFSSDLFRLPFAPDRSTYGYASLVVLATALGTAALVARRVNGLDMVAVLKARD
jgi:putative ABC transport system permease protein